MQDPNELIPHIIAFSNQKGGSGKTTSCISVAGCLAKNGYSVLVVDMDPQANATQSLGFNTDTLSYSLYDALLSGCNGYQGIDINDAIVKTTYDELYLVPSEQDLSVAEALLLYADDKARVLNNLLADLNRHFDYILIDLPPHFGMLLMNGLIVADEIVIPLEPSMYSLDALIKFKAYYHELEKEIDFTLTRMTVALIKYQKTSWLARKIGKVLACDDVVTALEQEVEQIFLIPESETVYFAQKAGMPLAYFRPEDKVSKAYQQLTKFLLN